MDEHGNFMELTRQMPRGPQGPVPPTMWMSKIQGAPDQEATMMDTRQPPNRSHSLGAESAGSPPNVMSVVRPRTDGGDDVMIMSSPEREHLQGPQAALGEPRRSAEPINPGGQAPAHSFGDSPDGAQPPRRRKRDRAKKAIKKLLHRDDGEDGHDTPHDPYSKMDEP